MAAPCTAAEMRLHAAYVRANLTAQQFATLAGRLDREALEAAGLTPRAAARLLSPDQAAIDADLEWLGRSGATLLSCADPRYPRLLRESPDAPAALYVLGDASALAEPQ